MKVLWGLSASFCNVDAVLNVIKDCSFEVQFVCSNTVFYEDSRFYSREHIFDKMHKISNDPILHTIHETENLTLDTSFDGMIIAPCTANTLAKLVNGIYDNGLLMAAKVMLRNQKPIIIGFSSNDGLGMSSMNLAHVLRLKHLYVVPFLQDNYIVKENSIISDWSLIEKTFIQALQHKQLQPILIKEN